MRAQIAHAQRRAQPDEEQRTEEPFGDPEQLTRQPSRFPDSSDHQSQREAGQHDRHVGAERKCRQREQNEQIGPQLQRKLVFLGILVGALTPALPIKHEQHREQ